MKRPGQRIKDERQAKGWSQQYLADEISRIKKEKITRAAVAQWENGDSKTQKPENLFAAAEALGVSAKWVLDGTGDKYQSASPVHHVAAAPVSNYSANLSVDSLPKTKRAKRIAEINAIIENIDTEGLAVLLYKAKDLAKDFPYRAQQTAS